MRLALLSTGRTGTKQLVAAFFPRYNYSYSTAHPPQTSSLRPHRLPPPGLPSEGSRTRRAERETPPSPPEAAPLGGRRSAPFLRPVQCGGRLAWLARADRPGPQRRERPAAHLGRQERQERPVEGGTARRRPQEPRDVQPGLV